MDRFMMMVNELVLFCGLFDWLEIDVGGDYVHLFSV